MASIKKITISDSVGKAIEQNIGKSLIYHTLGAIKARQDIAAEHGWEQCLDNEGDRVGDKLWMTHEAYEGKANKDYVSPITVSPDVKKGIAQLMYSTATLIMVGGKLPPTDPVAHLMTLPKSDIVTLMSVTVDNARHLLRVDPLCRDYDYPKIFKGLLESLVPKKMVDPGSDTIAKLIVDFIKVIAWHAAQRAYEAEHLTLNWATLLGIIASMASIPAAYGAAYEVINALRIDQLSIVKVPVKKAAAADVDGAAAPKKRAVKTADDKKSADDDKKKKKSVKVAAESVTPATKKTIVATPIEIVSVEEEDSDADYVSDESDNEDLE